MTDPPRPSEQAASHAGVDGSASYALLVTDGVLVGRFLREEEALRVRCAVTRALCRCLRRPAQQTAADRPRAC